MNLKIKLKDYKIIVFYLSEDIRTNPSLIIKHLKKFLKLGFRWQSGRYFNEASYFGIVGSTPAILFHAEKYQLYSEYKISFSRRDSLESKLKNLNENINPEFFKKFKSSVIIYLSKNKYTIWINKNFEIEKISGNFSDLKITKMKKNII